MLMAVITLWARFTSSNNATKISKANIITPAKLLVRVDIANLGDNRSNYRARHTMNTILRVITFWKVLMRKGPWALCRSISLFCESSSLGKLLNH